MTMFCVGFVLCSQALGEFLRTEHAAGKVAGVVGIGGRYIPYSMLFRTD